MIILNKSTSFYVLCYLALVLLAIFFVIFLTLKHGYDITDEGYFLLDYKNVKIYRGGIHNYHIVITKLTDWFNPGVIEYRLMTFILTLISSITLSIGSATWILTNYKIGNKNRFLVINFCMISIGNFLSYFTGFQIIHNNTLSNFFLQSITGIVLYLFSWNKFSSAINRKYLFYLLLLGVFIGFNFFIKFTSSILLLFTITLCLMVYYYNETKWNKGLILVSLFSACILGLSIYFVFFQSYSEWIKNFKDAYFMLSDHKPKDILLNYRSSFGSCLFFCAKYFIWMLILPAYILISKKRNKSNIHDGKSKVTKQFLIISILAFIYQSYYFKFYKSVYGNPFGIVNAYMYIIIIFFQISLLIAFKWDRKNLILIGKSNNLKKMTVLLLLFLIPFLGAFGTANSIFLNILIHIAPWFIIVGVLTIELFRYLSTKLSLMFFIIIPCSITFIQIAHGCIYEPFNSPGFFKTTELVKELPPINGIYLEKNLKSSLLTLNKVLSKNNYTLGYPIFAYSIPGIVYALGGISPGMPHFFGKEPRDSISMNRFSMITKPPIIFLGQHLPISQPLLAAMNAKKIIFPKEYYLVDSVKFDSPYYKDVLKIYFPKSFLN